MRYKLISTVIFALGLTFTAKSQTNSPLWLRYPAISPDGKTVVFCYKGDIYSVSAQGGEARAITSNPAYDYLPVWSPDGKTIAFASDRHGNFDVYTVPVVGGTPKRLTFHSANEYPSAFCPDGNSIVFSAHIQDDAKNILFPDRRLSELYSVPTQGGRIAQVLTTPAINACFSHDGKLIAYHDVKGYEDNWRKHHTSSVTRDVWIYDTQTRKHKKISNFAGEDRNPVFAPDGKSLFYLSEQNGSFNIVEANLQNSDNQTVITNFDKHPIRFLSAANNGTLCFTYNGEIYTKENGQQPKLLQVTILSDEVETEIKYSTKTRGASEMALSPDGKEIAIIIRGDIFVTATDFPSTKRITCTPGQERSVSFSPDGKKLLYASERDGSWNIYQTSIVSPDEANFSLSTLLNEEALVATDAETFQPLYSPDGKEVAFLEERTTLRIINLESKQTRTVLEPNYNYSYSDGDQWFQWSPDSRWLIAQYMETPSWPDEDIALIKADGSGQIHNLTHSGYSDAMPRWMMKGKAIIWQSDKMGMRSHGSWGAQADVYAMFLTQQAFDEFNLSKHEWKLLQDKQKDKAKKDKNDDGKNKKNKGKKGKSTDTEDDSDSSDESVEPLQFDLDNLDDRKIRLTINSANISDAVLTSNGEKLFYLCRFEKGYDLWVNNLKDKETKLLVKINGYASDLQFDKNEKNLYFLSDGVPNKIEISSNKKTAVKFSADCVVDYPQERAYIFEHLWRQVLKKFYDPVLHGIDWNYYKAQYMRFLPHINNNYDFSEMASEMLGELNGSHTGCRFYPQPTNADNTASLGVLYDLSYTGRGVCVAEVLDKSPLVKAKTRISAGTIIEQVDGVDITADMDIYPLLNRKQGKMVLLSLYNPVTQARWTETTRPISQGAETSLLYHRFVKNCNAEVERLSNGRIGYVHVKGMDSPSFRQVYSDLLGKHRNKAAVVVDTRFNGGGWLHDDLATLLGGKKYVEFSPRGQHIGTEPIAKWFKPSAVLVSEGNYSDAHGFPYVYKTLGIGKLVGMPVPGTMTAVWWETQIDPTLVFGIPQMGVKDLNGKYLENQQLMPDIQVPITPEDARDGVDTQLRRAVEELMKQI